MAYAPVSYTATAAQTDFVVTFDYLRPGHLVVRIDNVLKTLTTHYTLESGETIVRLVTPATGGETVAISRSTPVDERLVDFAAGAGISETDLDESFLQLFFNLEELLYLTEADNIAASVAAAAASAAAASASAAAALVSENAASASEIAAAASETAAAASAVAALGWSGIGGLALSRTSATVVSVAKGAARDSTNVYSLYLSAAETIDVSVSGVGGLGVARATSTWYHAFLIRKDSDASIDVYADTSVTAANKPAGYTAYRRVGSFYLNATGSGEVEDFLQIGDEFYWQAGATSVFSGTPGATTVQTATLVVPPDVRVQAIMSGQVSGGNGASQYVYLKPYDGTDVAASATNSQIGCYLSTGGAGAVAGASFRVWTDTSKRITWRSSDTTQNLELNIFGWRDLRGTNA